MAKLLVTVPLLFNVPILALAALVRVLMVLLLFKVVIVPFVLLLNVVMVFSLVRVVIVPVLLTLVMLPVLVFCNVCRKRCNPVKAIRAKP